MNTKNLGEFNSELLEYFTPAERTDFSITADKLHPEYENFKYLLVRITGSLALSRLDDFLVEKQFAQTEAADEPNLVRRTPDRNEDLKVDSDIVAQEILLEDLNAAPEYLEPKYRPRYYLNDQFKYRPADIE